MSSKRNLPEWMKEDLASNSSNNLENVDVPRRRLRSNFSFDNETENKAPPVIKPINYPPIKYKGKIEYYTEFNDIAESCDKLLKWVVEQDAEIVPIAFDMEWPFSFKTGPGKSALIQLCADTSVCYLYQLSNLKTLPAVLLQLLRNNKVKLHGVNIKNDFRKLERDFPEAKVQVMIDQCLDLGVWCNNVLNTSGRWSLERLVTQICKLKIDKNKAVRMSQWHVIPLNKDQKMYAAIDVYICEVIYYALEKLQIKQKYGAIKNILTIKEYCNLNEDHPSIEFNGEINYFNSINEIAENCDEYLDLIESIDSEVPLAFDIESPFHFINGEGKTVLIKLCLNTDTCQLYHLSEIKKLPIILFKLLTHKRIKLHGVNIKGNLDKLVNDFPEAKLHLKTDECIDLGVWYNNILEKKYLWNLEKLVFDIFKLKINKTRDIRMNEWNNLPLNDDIKRYAAVDIYISQVIYFELKKREIEKEETIQAFVDEYGDESLKAVNKLC